MNQIREGDGIGAMSEVFFGLVQLNRNVERYIMYHSKVDWWIGGLIFIIIPIIFVYSAQQAFTQDTNDVYFVIGSTLLYLITVFGLIFPIRYEINADQLIIRSGMIQRSVSLENIRGVQPSMNPLSAPALSIHRLEVECDRLYPLLISPKDREGFLEELAQRTDHLKREGSRLISQSSTM